MRGKNLLVEDEALIAMQEAAILHAHGFESASAASSFKSTLKEAPSSGFHYSLFCEAGEPGEA